jgi:hypothetical protein
MKMTSRQESAAHEAESLVRTSARAMCATGFTQEEAASLVEQWFSEAWDAPGPHRRRRAVTE